jgi:hypothetical protein
LGFGNRRFSLPGEFDMSNDLLANEVKSNFAMIDAGYAITLGLDAIVRYNRLDPNTDVSDDELQSMVVGF